MDLETTKYSAQEITSAFFDLIENGRVKEAQDAGQKYTRRIVRQDAVYRRVIPPEEVKKLDRLQNSDAPAMFCDLEPFSTAAVVNFEGRASSRLIQSEWVPMLFFKIESERFHRLKVYLDSYPYDIRQTLANNAKYDIGDKEDWKIRNTCVSIVNNNPIQRTLQPTFGSQGFTEARVAIQNRRKEVGSLVMTNSLFSRAVDLPATQVGSEIAGRHYTQGIKDESMLFGIPVIQTVKTDIFLPNECWVYAPSGQLGRFGMLRDITLFVKEEADKLEFWMWEYIGFVFTQTDAMQQLVFQNL